MAPTERKDPLLTATFKVSIDNSDVDINTDADQPTAFFNKVSGLKVQVDAQPLTEGGNTANVRWLLGKTTWPNITFQQGFASDMRFFNWAVNNPTRVNISVAMLGPNQDTMCTWTIRNAYPVGWTGPNFDAGQDQLAMESFVVAHEGFDISRPAPPPPPQPAPPPPKPIDAVVNFPTNSSTVPKPNEQLDAIGDALKKDPEKKVKIQGHTDSVGSHSSNVTLSQNRANSVRDYLVNGGTNASQISLCQGYGPDHPIASNDDAGGRSQNRRTTVKDDTAANDWE